MAHIHDHLQAVNKYVNFVLGSHAKILVVCHLFSKHNIIMFFLLSLSVCLSLPPTSSLFFPLALHRIKVIPETNHNTLFVSFTDDSTTKVWDVNKMEGLHVINKPKL